MHTTGFSHSHSPHTVAAHLPPLPPPLHPPTILTEKAKSHTPLQPVPVAEHRCPAAPDQLEHLARDPLCRGGHLHPHQVRLLRHHRPTHDRLPLPAQLHARRRGHVV